ncbi:MAG: ribosome maturation factor RimM [Lachnospiraceae bacterium]|nr:ribosome maturation factor RimM [Lachnospiraceae bacterium]
MEDLLKVGIISSTHGIKGEVKVFPTTDDPQRFKKLDRVLLDSGKEKRELKIQSVKFFKQFVIVKFAEINDINDVEQYKGSSLLVTRKQAVTLDKDEYFIADLIGISVTAPKEQLKGRLKDVIETGANDVYVIELSDGRELLLPAIKECVLSVDIEKGEMQIRLLDGLLE